MNTYQNPEFLHLYDGYTGSEHSIGGELTRLAVAADAKDPLVVTTATDMALYPGDGKPPKLLAFRLSSRGFKELAAVSHLGPAVGSLIHMRLNYKHDGWRHLAEDLRDRLAKARAANSVELWREQIAVEAYQGREKAIAAMCDYACAVTDRLLAACLKDETKLDGAFVRREYFEGKSHAFGASVSFNAVMIATFFLVGMDIAFRATRWFKEHNLDWSRVMVLVAGKQGRPTAGVTLSSNSIAQIVLAASDHRLPLSRIYIAPHAPTFTSKGPDDIEPAKALEEDFRYLWSYLRAIVNLGPTMFDGYPAYDPGLEQPPEITPETKALSEMPRVTGPDDMRAMTTRLRLVLEDPRQLLSGAITDYAAEQLRACGNDVSKVVVPGLDGYNYPQL